MKSQTYKVTINPLVIHDHDMPTGRNVPGGGEDTGRTNLVEEESDVEGGSVSPSEEVHVVLGRSAVVKDNKNKHSNKAKAVDLSSVLLLIISSLLIVSIFVFLGLQRQVSYAYPVSEFTGYVSTFKQDVVSEQNKYLFTLPDGALLQDNFDSDMAPLSFPKENLPAMLRKGDMLDTYQITLDVASVLDKFNIPYTAIFGTLLGQ